MDGVTLKFSHGGVFKKFKNGHAYVGGWIRTFMVDPDELCFWDLRDLAKKCGNYEDIQSLYYFVTPPNYSLLNK